MATALSGSTVYINDDKVDYIDKTLSLDDGEGQRVITPQVTGGGEVSIVQSRDFTTCIGKVNFEIFATEEALAKKREWKNNDFMVMRIVSPSGKTTIFEKMVLTNDVETSPGSEGTIPLEFQGSPAKYA